MFLSRFSKGEGGLGPAPRSTRAQVESMQGRASISRQKSLLDLCFSGFSKGGGVLDWPLYSLYNIIAYLISYGV